MDLKQADATKEELKAIIADALEQIEGRIAYWQSIEGSKCRSYVVANLQWAMGRLDLAPGRLTAMRMKSNGEGLRSSRKCVS